MNIDADHIGRVFDIYDNSSSALDVSLSGMTIEKWGGAYSGPNDTAALNAATSFNTAEFANAAGGYFGWKIDTDAKTLSLIYTPPPAVAAMQLTDAHSITVTFSTAVMFAGGDVAGAFRLTNLDANTGVDLSAVVSTDGQGRTVVTLTFSGSQTDGAGNLLGGHYALAIESNDVVDSSGLALDGAGTGTPGTDNLSQIWAVGG